MSELFLEDPDTNNYDRRDNPSSLSLLENCTHDYCAEGYCVTCGSEIGPKIEFSGGYSESHVKAKSSSEQDYYREIDRVEGLSPELKEVVASKLNQDMKHSRESSRL